MADEKQLPAVVTSDFALMMTPVMDAALAIARLEEFQTFVKSYLKEGIDNDYGTIPGTPKKTLLKPGADKLKEVYGLYSDFEIIAKVENWDAKPELFDYTIKCVVRSKRDSSIVSTGLGNCNSYESKYKFRIGKLFCPSCKLDQNVEKELRRSKQDAAWYCWAKLGGCGRQYYDQKNGEANEELTEQFPIGQVPNPDMASVKNTVLKMAEKRADIDATIRATRSSGLFTQDMDDNIISVSVEEVKEAKTEDKEARKAAPGKLPPKVNASVSVDTNVSSAGTQSGSSEPPKSIVGRLPLPGKSGPGVANGLSSAAGAMKTNNAAQPAGTKPATATTATVNGNELAGMPGLKEVLAAATGSGWVVNGDRSKATKKLIELVPALNNTDILKTLTVSDAAKAVAWFATNKAV